MLEFEKEKKLETNNLNMNFLVKLEIAKLKSFSINASVLCESACRMIYRDVFLDSDTPIEDSRPFYYMLGRVKYIELDMKYIS